MDAVEVPKGLSMLDEVVLVSLHTGTQIDALSHFSYRGEIYNGFNSKEHLDTHGWTGGGVGCELVFKPQLVIDIYHGSVLASGNCPDERPCGPFYQFCRQGERRRVLGEHDLRCSTFETEVIS